MFLCNQFISDLSSLFCFLDTFKAFTFVKEFAILLCSWKRAEDVI